MGGPATQQTTNMASSTVVGELTSARSALLRSRAWLSAASVDLCSLSAVAGEIPPTMISLSNGTTAGVQLQALAFLLAAVAQRCIRIMSSVGSMLVLRFVIMNSDPAISRPTTRTPKASANTLFVLSGAVVM